jgi:hypothetical protein
MAPELGNVDLWLLFQYVGFIEVPGVSLILAVLATPPCSVHLLSRAISYTLEG